MIVIGGFHLPLFVFPFVYQFNFRIGVAFNLAFANDYSKASRYAVFGSRKKPCSAKPCFVRFILMY